MTIFMQLTSAVGQQLNCLFVITFGHAACTLLMKFNISFNKKKGQDSAESP
jgi:hypothetical protein